MKPETPISKAGKLNSFQKTMLQWDGLHPYNAIHVVRIREPLDKTRLATTVQELLQRLGLNRLDLNGRREIFRYLQGQGTVPMQIILAPENGMTRLQAEIERELNEGFTGPAPFCPFRFFAIAESNSFFLACSYFHPVADAESIVRLMKRLVEEYLQNGAGSSSGELEIFPKTRDSLSRMAPALVRKLLAAPRLIRDMRDSCRPPFRDPENFTNRFTLFSLGPDDLERLVLAGKALGVTLNDLFLALLLKSVAPLARNRFKPGRRRKLSVGCIVNLRKELVPKSASAFGVFLGSFFITHLVPDAISVMDLARDIGAITTRIKKARLYSAMLLELALGRMALRLFSTARKKKLYQKHYPLWGGITNMNLNAIWDQRKVERPVDYFRAVSTGPVTPLVLSITTAGSAVNIGVSYRPSVFTAEEIGLVKKGFLNHLGQLEA